jgi:hypothetical protein
MDRHTKQHIKPKLRKKHKTLCYEYKSAISLEEVDVWYVAICYWWDSLGVVNEIGLQ